MPARIQSASARSMLLVASLLLAGPSCGGELEPGVEGDAGPGPSQPVRGAIPCGPRAVILEVCGQCHSRPPRNGAPYALVDLDDVRSLRDGEPISSSMIALVEQRRMPLAPAKITDEQRAVLLGWLRSGAPSTPTDCP